MQSKQSIDNFSKFLFEKFGAVKSSGSLPVYLLVLIVALAARIILFFSWLESPFRYYHKISGLDMKTVLWLAESFRNGNEGFSIYNLFVTVCLKIGGDIPTIIAGQCILGILTSLLITYVALRAFRNKIAAAIAGTIGALYGPELLYESVTLRESIFVFMATFSLAAVFHLKAKMYSTPRLIMSGCALAAIPMVRLAGILWTACAMIWVLITSLKSGRKNGLRFQWKLLLLPAAMTMTFTIVSTYNYIKVSNINPIPRFSSTSYVLKAGASENISSHSPMPTQQSKTPIISSYTGKLKNYAGKLISIFNAFEIPDNMNYYFVREFLKPLKYMPGPLLLIPLAALGILILACRRMLRGNTLLLLVYLFSFTVPLIVFIPIGRHRLVLLPVLCTFAGYAIAFILNCLMHFRKRQITILVLAAAYSALFIFASPKMVIMRAEDFVAYGSAMEISGKYDKREIEASYRIAYQLTPTVSAAIHLTNHLMKNSEFLEAAGILKGFYDSNPDNQTISINYASALMGTGKPEEAEKILLGISEPANRSSKVNYNFQLGESRRLQGKKAEALACYQLALEYSDTDEQRKIIQISIDRMK